MRLFASSATKAGCKAGAAWLHILEQTDEEIETLTGLDLYTHAKEEAKNWLRSHHKMPRHYEHQRYKYSYPEQTYHEEFTEYLEAFISTFPPRHSGYPKEERENINFDYLEEGL